MDDESIIELYWSRNEEAIVQTRLRYGNKLRGISFNILRNHEDAEECESETYLKTWSAIPPQRPTFFYAFLAKICRNISYHRLEWNSARKRSAEIMRLTEELEQCLPDRAAEMRFEGEELGQIISTFLRNQPRQNRIIFIRHYMFAEPVKDCANALGISESKVKSSLFRTRNKLRTYLEKEGIYV